MLIAISILFSNNRWKHVLLYLGFEGTQLLPQIKVEQLYNILHKISIVTLKFPVIFSATEK
jgi:hypothetical protein